jgi:hypothetical protein
MTEYPHPKLEKNDGKRETRYRCGQASVAHVVNCVESVERTTCRKLRRYVKFASCGQLEETRWLCTNFALMVAELQGASSAPQQYRIRDVVLHQSVSDHCAITAKVGLRD